MALKLFTFLALVVGANAGALTLTPDNFDAEVFDSGKSSFIKFLAPWWGHCKKMKPDWDKLAAEHDGSETVLIADVDCTDGSSKDLCSRFGVRGYPTIKTFNEGDTEGENYEGGRDLKSLKKAAASMGPSCSVKNYDLCSAEEKKGIDALKTLSPEERLSRIKTAEDAIEGLEKKFKEDLENLQATYKKLMDEKDTAVEELKKPLKGLKAFKDSAGGKKDEL